ncbi:MAG TPA: MFS transporter [bacterium]|nr:MFS transporter [bacterium]HPN42328.1 MFS transporter [bacterium]
MNKPHTQKRLPALYVPTLYFAEGLPYIIVNVVSVIMYKDFGVSNQVIGLTSVFMWPWVIKMLWAPFIDIHASKRAWVLYTQLAIGVLLLGLGAALHLSAFMSVSVIIFMVIAFVSASHDIAIDGYYMLALDESKQALYIGVRSTFYRIAVIFGSGALVVLAGRWQTALQNTVTSWQMVFSLAGAIFVAAFLFHRFYLPYPAADGVARDRAQRESFLTVFKTYFQQKRIVPVIIFILVYRFGEAMLEKMGLVFLKDAVAAGGLGLSNETVGLVKGTVGVICLLAGGLVGGWFISRFGLKKCIFPMALMLNLPDVVYIYMSLYHPPLAVIYGLIALEQFGYGVGFTAFMVFLMYYARGRYKTSHYAISTGIMALGMMIPGMLSGFLQAALGYTHFFITVLFFTIPGMIMVFLLPLDLQRKE